MKDLTITSTIKVYEFDELTKTDLPWKQPAVAMLLIPSFP